MIYVCVHCRCGECYFIIYLFDQAWLKTHDISHESLAKQISASVHFTALVRPHCVRLHGSLPVPLHLSSFFPRCARLVY